MECSQFLRSEMLLGAQSTQVLRQKRVILFGLGGVGSYAAEILARAGIGEITVVDHDTVSETNLNRQLCALHSTLGRPKAAVVRERLLDINPACRVTAIEKMYLPACDRQRDGQAQPRRRGAGGRRVADCLYGHGQ